MNALEELLDLLTCNDFEPEELAEMAERIQNAPNDPEYEWLADGMPEDEVTPELFMRFALSSEVSDYVAHSDKVDELHEQIEEMFEDSEEPLPPFPYEESDEADNGVQFYFEWLDEQLAERGDYSFLIMDVGLDDELHAIVVLRDDVDRILELASQLGYAIYSKEYLFL